MNRRALIISNPGERGAENYCKGVFKDVENYKQFLTSPVGGYWNANVIKCMHRPTVKEVQSYLSELKTVDYSLIVFSGHGYYSMENDSTILELRINEEFDSNDFQDVCEKQTIILDCCRVIQPSLVVEEFPKKALAKVLTTSDGKKFRKYYNERIAECRPGLIVLNACAIDETAGDDDQRGGYYSWEIIESAKKWADDLMLQDINDEFKILSAPSLHQMAASKVKRQTPQIEKPREGLYFPFAVVAKTNLFDE